MSEEVYLCCDTCCNETKRCIDIRNQLGVKKARQCSDYLIKESAKKCNRCAKKGAGALETLHFCEKCKDHFKTLAYIDGDKIGKYGVYCLGQYWAGDRVVDISFTLQTAKAFVDQPYSRPKRDLPIPIAKKPPTISEAQFYEYLYTLECEDRGFFRGLADYQDRHNEPLF